MREHDQEEGSYPRKSAWHLLFLPIAFIGGGGFCYGCVKSVCGIAALFNGHGPFLGYGESTKTLIVMPLFFASIPVGLLLTNLTIWCIPPVRRYFNQEAIGRPRGSFKEASSDLLKLALYIVPPLFAFSLAAALLGH